MVAPCHGLLPWRSRWLPPDLVRHATGAAPGSAPFVNYLKAKFGALYGV